MNTYSSRSLKLFHKCFALQSLQHANSLSASSNSPPSSICAFGSPKLELIGFINDVAQCEAFFARHHLKPNYRVKFNAHTATAQTARMFEEILAFHGPPPTIRYAGGSAQNIVRVAQWLLTQSELPRHCSIFGNVGDDDEAEFLRRLLRASSLHECYHVIRGKTTARTATIFTGGGGDAADRSGSRTQLSQEGATLEPFILASEKLESQRRIDEARLIFFEANLINRKSGGIVHQCLQSLTSDKYAAPLDKILISNMTSPTTAALFANTNTHFSGSTSSSSSPIEHLDILFGNEAEALSFAKQMAAPECGRISSERRRFAEFLNLPVISTDCLARVALRIAQLEKTHSPHRPRAVIFTQGSKQVVICVEDQIRILPVSPIALEEIVDLQGCGDAFIGAFLAALSAQRFDQLAAFSARSMLPLLCRAAQSAMRMAKFAISQYACNLPKVAPRSLRLDQLAPSSPHPTHSSPSNPPHHATPPKQPPPSF